MERSNVRNLGAWQLAAALGLIALVGTVGLTLRSTDAGAAVDPVVWVNDSAYGSAGKGFYHDFVSGQVWTAERDWHVFDPQPPRPFASILWVNYLTYGSAGGGFYLDSASGLVWTAERDWHPFDPRGTVVSVVPKPVPGISISYGVFCRTNIGCAGGPQPLVVGHPMSASFIFSATPQEDFRAEVWINGRWVDTLTSPARPYAGPAFNTVGTLGIAPAAGNIELRFYIGQGLVGKISAPIAASMQSVTTPVATPTNRPLPTATPYIPPSGGRTGAVCRDGWVSSSTGSGTCSSHGGVAYWLY